MGALKRRWIQAAAAGAAAIAVAVLVSRCGNQVDRNIAQLARGGEDAEEAKMALSMARGSAVMPLIAAFEDRSNSGSARADMADALFRLYLRGKDGRIKEVLLRALADPETSVRRVVVKALGDLRTTEAYGSLLDQLGREADSGVRQEILVTLGIMGQDANVGMGMVQRLSTGKMSDADKERFTSLLAALAQPDQPDSLRAAALDWLESLAEDKVVKAQELVVGADLAGAEALLQEALAMVPDSKNVSQRLGKFHYENGQREKGLQVLFDNGAAIRVPRLSREPALDGKLDDAVWGEVRPITRFYQNIAQMRAFTVQGETRAYVGYRNGKAYIGIWGYEPSTDDLRAEAKNRDELAYQDDCVEVFFDADRDGRTFHQFVINNTGTIMDMYMDGNSPGGDRGWNGKVEHAEYRGPDFWSIEMAIPLDQFGASAPRPGDVWAGNIARIRITHASEYGQWVPTYGSALRPGRFGYLVFE